LFPLITDWSNLLEAWKKASKGKRRTNSCAYFEHELADNLLELQKQLVTGNYKPGNYTHFYIHEPKRRCISAAPFRDRIVHHALCNIIEPIFEDKFIPDSYANRVNKGTHKAVNRFQQFSKQYRYVLRLDIVKHFPSIDHVILLDTLSQYIRDKETLKLISIIINSGRRAGEPHQQHQIKHPSWHDFTDDLPHTNRPIGLPIGNLTSQFWSNCYMHPLDLFIKRELSCKGYLRYVDDFALFSHSKKQLWEWKEAIRTKLTAMHLTFHENSAQVSPVHVGIPWLGFVIYPDYKRIKQRKVVFATRRLNQRYERWMCGEISFTEFDAGVQGWINHVRYADSWGLRKHILGGFSRRT